MNQRLTFVIASPDAGTSRELRAHLNAEDRAQVVAVVEIARAHEEIVRLQPSAAIITLNGHSDSTIELVRQIGAEAPETVIICASHNSSPDLILQSLRAGGREFIRLPVDTEEFRTVLDRTMQFCASRVTRMKSLGRVITVFSSKGGCGNSFIAANLAAAMSTPTALIDLNLQAGDLDLFFGIESRFSIADLIENRSRLDDSLLSGYLTPHSANLTILPAPHEAAASEEVMPEHVSEVIQILRERYDYVVIDPHHTLDSNTLAALDQADHIVLVLTLDVSSIRSAQRSLEVFDRLGYPRKKVHIVVNRWTKQSDIELQRVEGFLGDRVAALIPNDYQAAISSINLGKPLVESHPSSNVTAKIRGLAALVGDRGNAAAEAEKRKGLFGSLFRRQSKAARLELDAALNKA